jgi:putative addiction module component (TIGR02574 family)
MRILCRAKVVMSLTIQEIEEQALALSPDTRARLVDTLWESLDDTTYPVLSEAWQGEIERRRRELLEGRAEPVLGQEVSRRARELAEGGKP